PLCRRISVVLDNPPPTGHDSARQILRRLFHHMTTRHRMLLALILLTAVVLGGTLGFHIIEGWSLFDGFYMTLTTMTMIGRGEAQPLSHAGRIFNSFMIVAAVLAGGFVIA